MALSLPSAALIFAALWSLGCEAAKPGPKPKPEAAASPSSPTRSAPPTPAPAWSAPGGSGRDPSFPRPTSTSCPARPSPYFVTIQGSGEPLELRAGAPWFPYRIRNCEPARNDSIDGGIIAACADARELRKSCIWIRAARAAYFDRDGKYRNLEVKNRSFRTNGNVLSGSVELVGRAKDGTPPVELKVTVHVGTDVPTIDAPDAWQGTDPNRFPD